MDHVRSYDYRVPGVFGVDGPSMELERIEGPSLLDLAARRPHRIGSFAALLADLHHRLHQIPAPSGLASPFGRGGCVLHLDLQPANVIMTRRGPVVLDCDGQRLDLPRPTTPTPGSS